MTDPIQAEVMEAETKIARAQERPAVAIAAKLDEGMRMAEVFSRSEIVPKHFQGKVENCYIALHMAQQLGENPLSVMQNLYIVHGTPSWKASYLIARANRSGVFRDRIWWTWEGSGEALVVTAHAVLKNGQQINEPVSMKMALREGWSKQNPKYQSMPLHMLSFRSATFLVRKYCPEVMLGFTSMEELEDVHPVRPTEEKVVTIDALVGVDPGEAKKAVEEETLDMPAAPPAAVAAETEADILNEMQSSDHVAVEEVKALLQWAAERKINRKYVENAALKHLGCELYGLVAAQVATLKLHMQKATGRGDASEA